MQVELLCKQHHTINGLARYARSLTAAYDQMGLRYRVAAPQTPPILRPAVAFGRKLGLDVSTFLQTFPLSADFESHTSIKHLTSQEMATWLTTRRSQQPIVVTVHDILPHLLQDQGELAELHHPVERRFYRRAMRGLTLADHLVADSDYTKRSLIKALGIRSSKISVVPLAIDHTLFRPVELAANFFEQFELQPHHPIVLYVGSDAPRKNLGRLLAAFQHVHQSHPEAIFIKVGSFTNQAQADKLRAQIASLGLTPAVRVVNNVSAENLVNFYNAASVFVFPSLYEGFGLPPLEAMACGAPVACSNSSSLPEVVGDAALLFDPTNIEMMRDAIEQLLTNATLATKMRQRGLQQAQRFRWCKTAEQTAAVYQML